MKPIATGSKQPARVPWRATRHVSPTFASFNTLAAYTLFALSACGGGDGGGGHEPATAVTTLAYVTVECREEGGALGGRLGLQIRQGDREPITVAGFTLATPLPGLGFFCPVLGRARVSGGSGAAGLIQRLGVSPDGSLVVFEATNAFSILPVDPLPAEQEGIFVVRADGSGLRRLGAATHESPVRVVLDPSSPIALRIGVRAIFAFSPDGRTIVFPDKGPGPAGEEATQIVTIDLLTGMRTQLTHLPFAPPPDPLTPATLLPSFVDNGMIQFVTITNPDGTNPRGDRVRYTVRRDGTGLKITPAPMALPGSLLVPTFQITGDQPGVDLLRLPGLPENTTGGVGLDVIREVFLVDGPNLLQLTDYHRVDTTGPILTPDGLRVLFTASADPLGSNPSQNCQVFSIDRTGANPRQLTNFRDGEHSEFGCSVVSPPGQGCTAFTIDLDPGTGSLLLLSTCDPLGRNPNGAQVFTMRPDGTGLRQLTNFRGYVIEPDGTPTYEFPGYIAYGRHR